jgi:hypothetical protein
MKHPLMIGIDAIVGVGFLSSVFHVLPQAVGTGAGALAMVWYSVLIYDRIIKKRDIRDQ